MQLYLFRIFFITIFAFGSLAQASKKSHEKSHEKSKPEAFQFLKQATLRYRKSEMTAMKVVKVVKSDLLGTETKFAGKISISAGLFRWENTEPDRTLIVYDGETIWNEQSPPKEFPGPMQVAKAKLDRKNKAQVMISSLLGGTSIFENFKVISEKLDSEQARYSIEPKTSDLKIKDLEIVVLKKQKEVSQISYKDDVGNITTMNFSDIEFNKKKSPNLFKYTPPKGAQVNSL